MCSAKIKVLASDLVNEMLKPNCLQRHMPEKAGRFLLRKVLAGEVLELLHTFKLGVRKRLCLKQGASDFHAY